MRLSIVGALLPRLAILFAAAWAVRSLIVSGDAVLNEPFQSVFVTPPRVTQAKAGDGFEQSLLRIDATIPPTDRVVVLWVDPPYESYVFFWSTYWLYPRKVTVVGSLDRVALTPADTLVDIRLPAETEPVVSGYYHVTDYSHSDYVVTVYRRAG
jgi:hypothetical protein